MLPFLPSLSQCIKAKPIKQCTTPSKHGALYPRTVDLPDRADVTDFSYIHFFVFMYGAGLRLLLFKECLRNNIVPFIIEDDTKMFYYRGMKGWQNERGYLRDTCLAAQDRFKKYLDYFRVPYDK